MRWLSKIFYSSFEITELQNVIRELELKLKHQEEIFNLKLSIKDNEIKNLNMALSTLQTEKSLNTEPIVKKKLSSQEERVLKYCSQYNCQNYNDLSKVTTLKISNLRNVVKNIRKKGHEFKFYV